MLALGSPRFSYPGWVPEPGETQRSALWPGSAAVPLRAGPRLARGPREPRAPRASEELRAGAKVSSQLRPRAPPPPPTPARGLGPALPRSPGPPPEAGPGRAAPAVSLWRVEPPPAPGRPASSPRPLPALGLPWGFRGAVAAPGPGVTRGDSGVSAPRPPTEGLRPGVRHLFGPAPRGSPGAG